MSKNYKNHTIKKSYDEDLKELKEQFVLLDHKINFMNKKIITVIEDNIKKQFAKNNFSVFISEITINYIKNNLSLFITEATKHVISKQRNMLKRENEIIKNLALSTNNDIKSYIRDLDISYHTEQIIKNKLSILFEKIVYDSKSNKDLSFDNKNVLSLRGD